MQLIIIFFSLLDGNFCSGLLAEGKAIRHYYSDVFNIALVIYDDDRFCSVFRNIYTFFFSSLPP